MSLKQPGVPLTIPSVNQSEPLAFSITDAAVACSSSKKVISLAVRSGELPARRLGVRVLILRTDLLDWLDHLPTDQAVRAIRADGVDS